MSKPLTYAERKKRELREEIVNTAFDVFAEQGYHEAGVADIAARVGMGHSTFYRHFESKRAILDQVVTNVIERIKAALAAENAPEAATSTEEYRKQARRIAIALDDIFRDPRVARLMLIQAGAVDTELEQRIFGVYELAVRLTTGYFDNGRDRGYLRADLDSTATARAVVGLIIGTETLLINPNLEPAQRTRTLDAAVRLMLDGIT
ncbi:TetR/AcrR family transcriptional regulator [Kibdelosporangium philippinense]|uniref:TetR/AcrR family transcriptional regulator n=1 Tax=Kibdelosporangium philippinense TaxID=211113 RepID=A0ABS8ZAM6_9PSEU|nr:TetR/AcrR family transcriptional regulator [Kibdelosporangium philippinense]MCE7004093.1 TetR/AcrR family transcriptional regulator [Kibdelosporangium philippinense]